MTLKERLEKLVEEAIDNYDIDGYIEDWIEDNDGFFRDLINDKLIPVMNEAIEETLNRHVEMALDEIIDSPSIYGYALESIEEEID